MTMLAGRGKAALANPAPPAAPPEPPGKPASPPAPPPRRWRWALVALAIVAATAVLASFGAQLVGAAHQVAGRLVGGGRLYWSSGEHAWQELPIALLLRRDWGPTDAVMTPDWGEVAPGLALADVRFSRPPDPRDIDLVVIRIDPSEWQFRVWGRADWSRAPVATLAKEAGLALAVNGPYFAEDGPLGLVVSDGVSRNRQGSRRAAHFLVDRSGRPRIVNAKGADVTGVEQGFQGFPAIMTGGRTFSYLRTGGRGFDVRVADRRTAACVTGDKHVLLVATDIWTGGLSLSELATVLGALGCVDAMGFDGGASTALSLHVGDTHREIRGLDTVPVIVGVSPRND